MEEWELSNNIDNIKVVSTNSRKKAHTFIYIYSFIMITTFHSSSNVFQTFCLKVVHIQFPSSLLCTVYMNGFFAAMGRTTNTGTPCMTLATIEILTLFHTFFKAYNSSSYQKCVWDPDETVLMEPNLCLSIFIHRVRLIWYFLTIFLLIIYKKYNIFKPDISDFLLFLPFLALSEFWESFLTFWGVFTLSALTQ